jgi:hypothetical protein
MLDAYPSDLQAFVQQKIATGEFKSADEFAVQAARVYREIDLRHQKLKQSVVEAIADIEAGNYLHLKSDDELRQFGEDVNRRGRERLSESTLNS